MGKASMMRMMTMGILIQNSQLALVNKDVLHGLLILRRDFILRILLMDLSGEIIHSRLKLGRDCGAKVILKRKMNQVI
ncbi:hypothetical protein B296_00015969 [Ensete ventricosum]|uniref:Uncharacterized protein n=1 Tax=Ensete ventricosum TaxID=4639 RepID=A0A426YK92_ENSVE|nr:hypothetical protein B296_00015969 [Ensete ventricosum]